MRLPDMSGTATAALFVMICAALIPAAAADAADSVTTPGSGALTICRNWLVYDSCTTYSKVALPERVAVGDKLTLTYGSNPKDYTFRVLSIRHQGTGCTIFSDASGATAGGEKIEVAECKAMADPAANAR